MAPWLLVFALLGVLPLSAQTAKKKAASAAVKKTEPPAAQEWPIGSITIEGNKVYPAAQVVAATGLKVGQLAGKTEFEAARDRLLATGAFESVGYRFAPAPGGNKYAATFDVLEIQQVFPYRFEGLTIDPKAATAWLHQKEPLFADRIPATQVVLERFSKEVQAFLATTGKEEQVLGRLIPENKDRLEIVFTPSKLPVVAEVDFTGIKSLQLQKLRLAIAGVAVGQAYSDVRFQQLLDSSVRPLYEEIGKIRVSFPKLVTKPAKEVNGLIVEVTVDEGSTYNLGKVYIVGEMAGSRDLVKEGGFKSDEPVNFTEVNSGIDKIMQRIKRKGYVRSTVESERKIDDKEKKVDLAIRIEPGPQYQFGKLTVEGLDIISEPYIRKLWSMKPGQPYDAEYPYYFLKRVEEDGIFENLGKTRTALHIDDQSKVVDVSLFFSGSGKPLPRVGPGADKPKPY